MIIEYRCKHCENTVKRAKDKREESIIISFIDCICGDCKKLLQELGE